MKRQGAKSSLSGVPAFFCSKHSIVKETKFALSNSWLSSAAIIGTMQLTITDSHFVLAIANLGSKIFETSLEVAVRTFKRLRK